MSAARGEVVKNNDHHVHDDLVLIVDDVFMLSKCLYNQYGLLL